MKSKAFARKYGKRYGGVLFVEGSETAEEILKSREEFASIEAPDKVVNLIGYIDNNRIKGRVSTGLVVGLALHDGHLYAITSDTVYQLDGPYLHTVITTDPFLLSLWQEVAAETVKKYRKSR